jgi:glutamate/aspartate transport system substrate-binding protein
MTLRATFALALAALTLVAGAVPVHAAPRGWPDALSGRLAVIAETRVVRLGYREKAIPFSYLGHEARPVGYTLDLCLAIVATIAEDLGGAPLAVEYVTVTPQDRFAKVTSGAVDLECGVTTITAQRQREVAFSPVIFVSGTRLVVPRGRGIRELRAFAGRPVAVVRGTANEATLREYDRRAALRLDIVVADSYREAIDLLGSGKADALAADDVLVRAALIESGRGGEFRLVGDLLSFEPYGIAFARGDPKLADAVVRTFKELAASRQIVWLYNRWFVRPLPSGQRLDMPMSTELRVELELLGLPRD